MPKIKKLCKTCGIEFYIYPYRDNTAHYCSRRCGCIDKKHADHNHWKGGRSIMKNGYVRIRVDGKYIYEHRYVMEKHLGRLLEPYENIHHIDGNKTNNKIGNLEILIKKDHDRFGTISRWKENPKSFSPDRPQCLQPRIDRKAKGKLCQCYLPCRFHSHK